MNELKKYQIGEWCKRAAWVVAIVGVLDIFVETVALFIQNSSYGNNAAPLPLLLPQVLNAILVAIPTPLFDALILYATGVVVNRFLAYTEGNERANDAMPSKGEIGGASYSTVPPKGRNDDVAQAAVETAAAKTSTAEPRSEKSDVTQAAAETTPAQSTSTESNVAETTDGDNTPEATLAQPKGEKDDVTAVEVEDTVPNSTAVQAEDKKSKLAAGNARSKAKK